MSLSCWPRDFSSTYFVADWVSSLAECAVVIIMEVAPLRFRSVCEEDFNFEVSND